MVTADPFGLLRRGQRPRLITTTLYVHHKQVEPGQIHDLPNVSTHFTITVQPKASNKSGRRMGNASTCLGDCGAAHTWHSSTPGGVCMCIYSSAKYLKSMISVKHQESTSDRMKIRSNESCWPFGDLKRKPQDHVMKFGIRVRPEQFGRSRNNAIKCLCACILRL